MTSAHVKLGKNGVWECRPYLGETPDGRQIRPYRSFPTASSEEEAQELADTWVASLTAGGDVGSARLADLLDGYVALRERNGASPNSVRSYRLFSGYVRRYLGGVLASDLTVMDLNRFEQRLMAPRDRGGQGLSRNSVVNVHMFLRGAYNHLVDAGVVDANPMLYVAKPSPERHEAAALTEWDYAPLDAALRSAISGESYRDAVRAFAAWLSLAIGVRVGEACAIRRVDVNRVRLYVHVAGNVIEEAGKGAWRRDVTKGRRCRNVSITEEDLGVIDAIVGLQAREVGPLPATAPLVTLDGSFMRPTSVSRSFTRLARRIGLPDGITYHSLRHTHASWLIARGVDLKTVSERMGHADEATTLRIYGHLMPGRDQEAARVMGEAMRAAASVP